MAVDLSQQGVDRSVIALWLGHESLDTTQHYLEATLAIKEASAQQGETAERQIQTVSAGRPSPWLPEQPVEAPNYAEWLASPSCVLTRFWPYMRDVSSHSVIVRDAE